MAISEGEKGALKFPKGAFVKELHYTMILDYYILGLTLSKKEYWVEVKTRAEGFLEKWPDYRMVESVEDNYEMALKKLAE